MARIRTVKPELFTHEGLFEAEQYYQLPLRLAFIALFTCCDREGRFRWQPKRLKLSVLPYDEVDISQVLDALVTRGFVVKYQDANGVYGCIPSWERHQVINHREADSELPGCEIYSGIVTSNDAKKSNNNNEVNSEPASLIDACPTREARVVDASGACPGGIGNKEYGKEGEGNRKGLTHASRTQQPVSAQDVSEVFNYWRIVMNRLEARLDYKRRSFIRGALRLYTVQQLCQAIDGCSLTPYNMGDNPQGQRFDGLHVILRDAEQIDRFLRHAHSPPRPANPVEKRAASNQQTLARWIDKKMRENGKPISEDHFGDAHAG